MGTGLLGTDSLQRADLRPRRLRWTAIAVYSISVLVSLAFWIWVFRLALRFL
jgi:hypothetical protein